MRVVIPQITWHSRDQVLSVDFDPSCKIEDVGYHRIASGGGDRSLLVWRLLNADTLKPEVNCVAELKRHEKPVNVVRFSPDGNYIASGGDDAYIILWKCGDKNQKDADGKISENWMFEKSLRKHIEDVADLGWSPDSNFLVSASIDNSAVLWDVKKGQSIYVWSEKEHSGYVHGVSYDPLHEFVATMCIDRNLRMFDRNTNKLTSKALKYPDTWISQEIEYPDEKENIPESRKKFKNKNATASTATTVEEAKKPVAPVNRLFQDEFLPTFCRRLSFSPRGELLMVPGGMLPPGQNPTDPKIKESSVSAGDEKKKKPSSNNNAVILFCRHSWTNPCAVIPTLNSFSTGGRFCPIYFKKERQPYKYNEEEAEPTKKNERMFACVGKIAGPKESTECLMKMPYRLVYAVATNDTILIGDTASSEPLAVVRSIHLARITDISWAPNGRAIMVSSTDGYCSVITFGEGELGQEFQLDAEGNIPQLTRDCFPILPPEPKKPPVKKEKTKKVKKPKTPAAEGPSTPEQKKGENVSSPTATGKKPVVKAKTPINVLLAKAPPKKTPKPKSTPTPKVAPTAEKNEDNEMPVLVAEGLIPITEDVVMAEEEGKVPPPIDVKTPAPKKSTFLDAWITKTPKSAGTAGDSSGKAKARPTKVKSPPAKTSAAANVEIITVDDDSQEETPTPPGSSTTTAKLFPMTPPMAKQIAVRRAPRKSKEQSPLARVTSPFSENGCGSSEVSATSPMHGGVSPEELEKLTTAPIKCRRSFMEEPVILMQSSPKLSQQATQLLEKEKSDEVITTPKSDAPAPSSPVSSAGSTPRPPRRITLGPPLPTNNGGNLD